MELRQLRYFVAVVDAGSFTRAAERLHLAQPGVSAQIGRLERELGQPLLHRSRRAVRPTRAGEAMVTHARAALAAAERVRGAVDAVAGLERGQVTLGAIRSHEVELAGLLGDVHRAHPGLAITLTEEAGSERLAEAVRRGELDVALIALGADEPEGLVVHVVVDSWVVAAVPADHAWGSRRSVHLRTLAGPPLICLPRGSGLRSRLDRAFAALDVEPVIAFEASSPAMLARLALAGVGVALVPSVVAAEHEGLHPIPIVRPRLRGRLGFVWRPADEQDPACAVLVGHIRERFAPPVSAG